MAVKRLHPSRRDDPDAVARFFREARICARLQHPGIVPIHDVGRFDDGGPFSAYIEGRMGIIEVDQGDMIPGLGRVDAIRKQDGRWVVVTSKGLIVPSK